MPTEWKHIMKLVRNTTPCGHGFSCPKCCLIYTGTDNGTGYGRISIDGKYTLVHRAVYEYFSGKEILPGSTVNHKCNQSRCWKYEHLYLGTHKENGMDRYLTNRGVDLLDPAVEDLVLMYTRARLYDIIKFMVDEYNISATKAVELIGEMSSRFNKEVTDLV